MADIPAAYLDRKPKPFYPVYDKAAGTRIFERGDAFRSCFVVPKCHLMVYAPAERWNQPGTKSYSSVPLSLFGEPFNTSKPRKGRWGETLDSKISLDSAFLHEAWDKMTISRKEREEKAFEEARRDLQRRIDICLYGTPRFPDINVYPCQGPK